MCQAKCVRCEGRAKTDPDITDVMCYDVYTLKCNTYDV